MNHPLTSHYLPPARITMHLTLARTHTKQILTKPNQDAIKAETDKAIWRADCSLKLTLNCVLGNFSLDLLHAINNPKQKLSSGVVPPVAQGGH